VERGPRDRFALFLIGWLGGPQEYMARHGHPRLRLRHAKVPIDDAMATAWMRCMRAAFDRCEVHGDVRDYVEARLGEVAAFLRNRGT
jgi:hemoglobin